MLIDSHCHLNSDELRANADALVRRAVESGVGRMLVVGCDLENSREAVAMAHRFQENGVFAAVGVHPHEATRFSGGLPEPILDLVSDERVVAIGETGLDYYYDHSPRDVQRDVFAMHLDWAVRSKKPLVLHVRDAMDDVLSILNGLEAEKRSDLKLLFHCYSGGLEYLDAVLELGAWCALGGAVTWDRNDRLREVVARIPEDRLLFETDCPWMAPKPFRGRLNEPSYVRLVYETVAAVRGVGPAALAARIERNADAFFGWGASCV